MEDIRRLDLNKEDLSEAVISTSVWLPIFRILFQPDKKTKFLPEYNIKSMEKRFPSSFIDYCLIEHSTRCPLLVIELAIDPIKSAMIGHKDEEKMAVIMALSLTKRISHYRRSPKVELEKLRVFGLLIGGFGFEVCVMLPMFNLQTDGTYTVDYIFCTSRESWRFDLLLPQGHEQIPLPPTGNFICRGSDEKMLTFNPSKNSDIFDELCLSSSSFRKSSSGTSSDSAASTIVALDHAGNVNESSVQVLFRVKDLVLSQADVNLTGTSAEGSLSSDGLTEFTLPNDLVALIQKGRGNHNESTPWRDERYGYQVSSSTSSDSSNSSGSVRKRIKVHQQILLKSVEFETITTIKAIHGNEEVEVYLNDLISKSNCFPRLVSYKLSKMEDSIELVIEKVIPFKEHLVNMKENLSTSSAFIIFKSSVSEPITPL